MVGGGAMDARFKTEAEFLLADRRRMNGGRSPTGRRSKGVIIWRTSLWIISSHCHQRGTENRPNTSTVSLTIIYTQCVIRQKVKAHDRPPKVEETLMTMAYCASKRSSCLKRKVGAVVAYIRSIKNKQSRGNQDPRQRDLPFQIVSFGYNDIPAGTPCVFSPWRGFYQTIPGGSCQGNQVLSELWRGSAGQTQMPSL